METNLETKGFFKTLVKTFLTGPLSILFILFAIMAGVSAIIVTPREEEPQIVVPMVDILVNFPGNSPAEVAELVTKPLEKLIWQIDGIEHVYSQSLRDQAMVTARFYVGEDRDRAMVKIRDKIEANQNLVPPGVAGWLIRPVEIDDVPIVTLTLKSFEFSASEIRRVAEEVETRLARTRNIFKSEIHGGYKREIRIEPDQMRMQAYTVCFQDIKNALALNNYISYTGTVLGSTEQLKILSGNIITSAEEIKRIPIFSRNDKTIYIEDVANVEDTFQEPDWYHFSMFGPAQLRDAKDTVTGKRANAVTISFSKKKGTNAIDVAQELLNEAKKLKGTVIPKEVELVVSRNYGRTANEKVNELLSSIFFAILTVVGLLAFTMGWRSAVVVGLAVPISFALALFTNLFFGYTINRVTLFALILSLGLVVDDPITNVDNIQRHLQMQKEPPMQATLSAIEEVIVPVIMSTLAIIVSFAPMFYITGMMGPYMAPMAINVPLTVSFSTVCALTFVPWLAFKLLERGTTQDADSASESAGIPPWIRTFYRKMMAPFLNKTNAYALIAVVLVLLVASTLLLVFRKIPVKMLPFDNKDELQLILDLPEGTSLQQTDKAVAKIEQYLAQVNEVKTIQSYVGIAAPIDFNGLVRHYALRNMPNQADIRINLAAKDLRKQQSHAIALRLRDDLTKIADEFNATLSIVEVPPGPPVFSTLTVEVYGDEDTSYEQILKAAEFLQEQLKQEDSRHIAQIDNMNQAPHDRLVFIPNLEKASLHGLNAMQIQMALAQAGAGTVLGVAHIEHEREPTFINLRLPISERNNLDRLKELALRTQTGALISLSELGEFKREKEEQIIFHKNLRPMVFVTAEIVGRPPVEIVLDMQERLKKNPLPKGITLEWAGEGEWEITTRVFRDLGIAFGVAMLGIYLLLAVQMNGFLMPILVMSAVPLTIIGIAPGFYLLNLFFGNTVGGFPDPIFFTATGMIGVIALGGIVVRNSIVLIEFIEDALKLGKPLKEAILESGAVRFRPITLTAGTTLLGTWPITLDPIFSGLAWALIFGLLASTVFSLLIIPTLYYLVADRSTTNQEVSS